ncbi:Antibiotic biosynthesis monooxygenase [Cupriavidus taiwanensis]|uniref:Antibiotic biosynthesis monooxygenase n=1 Tax=Cupriavidus taiwanensis TaxID=164546 RepID=A0A976B2T0_9BURK|nr:putative quinol monooxygenase [Cupriavidus taiwanensis]SOZ72904.1 Antibiotic biosynthesis monooxygenase [Cupriavidus taiwanensis]SPA03854.1 Antibiotic biosynthesis monooxygenase [Cupriavidus taiwanensis]SPA09762.1 Antibiotic biosynthesis monooxygenase [Cupriavidus taiwanensis]SPA23844.1 Antibiotic biosynthesis monooxygenase [Cupriavidus taiwanensis]
MLGVVAQISVKPGTEAQFEELANQLVQASRQEEGCLEYGLWRTEVVGQYAFVERYKDAGAVEAHKKSEHYRQIGRAMGAFMEGTPSVIRLTAV